MSGVLAYGGALVSAMIFLAVVKTLGLVGRSSRVLEISRQSMGTLRDPTLDDDAKEARMRRDALTLARLGIVLTLGLALAAAAPLPLLWLLQRGGVVSIDEILRASLSWQFILGAVVCLVAKLEYDRRARRGAE